MRVFKFSSTRGKLFCYSCNASARCFDALRLLNMTENKGNGAKNNWFTVFRRGDQWSPALCLMAHYCVIPSEVEEFRGNDFFFFPAA